MFCIVFFVVWKISWRGKSQACTEEFTWNIYLPNLGYHWWSAVILYINLLQMKLRKAFSILFSAKVVTENIMNAINRKRGKCKFIQQGRFTFFPALRQLTKVDLRLWGPLLLEVTAATSLVHLAKFGGWNNLPFPLDTRDARNILETHFKQRNPSNETGVEDESFYLTAYIPIALTGKAVSNWRIIQFCIFFYHIISLISLVGLLVSKS